MADPYGGADWIQQAIQAAVQAAMQQINWSQLMGYGYESMYAPGAQRAPTLNEAYYAIYESRPDLQEQRERKYSDWSVTRYMEHWWEGSGEMSQGRHWTDPATGMEWVNTKDVTAVEFAIARGYVDPGPEPSGNYGMLPTAWRPPLKGGETEQEIARLYESYVPANAPWQQWAPQEGVPTLERQRMEADEAYRQALLEFDRGKQAFIEGFAYDEMALNEALERLRLSQQQQQYMNEYEIAQAQLALQTELGMGDLQLRELMRLDQISQHTAELDWAREMYYDQSAFASRQQDWAEWMGRSDLELRQELAELEGEVARGNLALEQRRFDLEDFLARDQNARENKYYELEYILSMSQEERAGQRFEFEQLQWQTEHEQRVTEFQQTLGLSRWEAEQRASEFEQQFGLAQQEFGWGQQTWQAEHEQRVTEFQQTYGLDRWQAEQQVAQFEQQFGLAQQQFGLEQQYFGLSEQELQLQQLQTLLSQTGPQNWPQYWAASRAMPEAWGPQGEPVPAWARTLTEGGQYPAFGAAGQVPQGIYGGITPQQVSPQQWAGLSPSEIQGLSGQVQTGGGFMPDWMAQMTSAWPQGQATPISYFGG